MGEISREDAQKTKGVVFLEAGADADTQAAVAAAAAERGMAFQVVTEILSCETCKRFECICAAKARHAADCEFLVALACPVGVECDDHGEEVCPHCDPCTCGAGVSVDDFTDLQVRV